MVESHNFYHPTILHTPIPILKSVPKVVAHFAFFVNIFRNFNAIFDFSFAMNSYGHEANF